MEGDNCLSCLSRRKESTEPIAHLCGSSPLEEHQLVKRHHSKAYSRLVEKAHTGLPHPAQGPDVEVQRVPDGKGGPSSGGFVREGLSKLWAQRTKSGWASKAQPARLALRPPWSCSVSVQSGSLGERILKETPGQLCSRASVPSGALVRDYHRRQWEDSWEANRSICAWQNRLQITRASTLCVASHVRGVGLSAARLRTPGTWVAADSKGGDVVGELWYCPGDTCMPPSRCCASGITHACKTSAGPAIQPATRGSWFANPAWIPISLESLSECFFSSSWWTIMLHSCLDSQKYIFCSPCFSVSPPVICSCFLCLHCCLVCSHSYPCFLP